MEYCFQVISIRLLIVAAGRRRIATRKEQYGLHAFHVTVLNHLDQNVKCKILFSLSQLWNLN